LPIKEVVDMIAVFPHLYPDGLAESCIATHQSNLEKQTEITFAIV